MSKKNTVILLDRDRNVPWEYEIQDEEEYQFLQKRGEWDDEGRLILDLPIIAGTKKFSIPQTLGRITRQTKELSVPSFDIDESDITPIQLENLYRATNSQLEEYLAKFGGYKAYLEAKLSEVASEKSLYESAFEAGLNKAYYELEKAYKNENHRKPNKESLKGEAFSRNGLLRDTYQKMIEVEALFIRIEGLKNAYTSAFNAVSRIVALRTLREQV
jgi:hypothetical protein